MKIGKLGEVNTIGKVRLVSPISGSGKPKTKNPLTNGGKLGSIKAQHAKTLRDAGVREPRSPLS